MIRTPNGINSRTDRPLRSSLLFELAVGGSGLLAFNDLFLGAQTHVSARYRIRWAKAEEPQSSSGVRRRAPFWGTEVGINPLG
jgi:hypothetical protein